MKRKLLIVLFAVVMCVCLAACSSKKKEKVADDEKVSDSKDGVDLGDVVDAMFGGGYMKYVDKSRFATDCNSYDTVCNVLVTAGADPTITMDGTYHVVFTESSLEVTKNGEIITDADPLDGYLKEVIGDNYTESMRKKTKDVEDYVIDVDYSKDFKNCLTKTVDPNTFQFE